MRNSIIWYPLPSCSCPILLWDDGSYKILGSVATAQVRKCPEPQNKCSQKSTSSADFLTSSALRMRWFCPTRHLPRVLRSVSMCGCTCGSGACGGIFSLQSSFKMVLKGEKGSKPAGLDDVGVLAPCKPAEMPPEHGEPATLEVCRQHRGLCFFPRVQSKATTSLISCAIRSSACVRSS